jgi:hypothetical protein
VSRLQNFFYVGDAFNPDNFCGNATNNLHGGRECALVGVPQNKVAKALSYEATPYELLFETSSCDDIVVGLLNKPQYVDYLQRRVVWLNNNAMAGPVKLRSI